MSMTTTAPATVSPAHRTTLVTALLCWLTVALEGFDLVAFGAVIPTLLETRHLGMTGDDVALVATLSLVGVGIGAAAGGPFIDRFGRRVGLTASVAVFSLFTLLVPLAPSVTILAAVRLLAGLGLGACMPTAITIMTEAGRADRKATSTTVTMTGYHVGAVAMSLLALAVLPSWQTLFYVGGLAGLLLLPATWFYVPETSAGDATTERPAERPSISGVVAHHPRAILCSWLASFMGLLLVYGLNTWLPQIMRSAGYSLTSSLSLLLIMNAGAIVGLALGGMVADRGGIKRSTIAWFAASAVFLAFLSLKMESQVLLHLVVFVTGLFVFSAQGLVYALVAHLFDRSVRGTALGMASGVGRLGAIAGPAVTGVLVTAGLGHPWGFYVFAAVAVLATAAVALMPAHPREGGVAQAASAYAGRHRA